MEFEGKVYKILPPTSGTSARGGEWRRQDVVFEMPQEFSRKICVTFFNKDHEVAQLREGMLCNVAVNVESREYNGRWYTDVRAWRITPVAAEPVAAEPEMPAMPPIVEEPSFAAAPVAEVDDLPF